MVMKQVLATPMLTYPEICRSHQQGLYLTFEKEIVLYVGKTAEAERLECANWFLTSEVISSIKNA